MESTLDRFRAAAVTDLSVLETRRGFLYPAEVEITGSGHVWDQQGQPVLEEDVTWIWGLDPKVGIVTQSDAWLPYNLYGQPQPAIWLHNFGRLSRALAAIETALGSDHGINYDSAYSFIHGFHLFNKTTATGKPSAFF